MAPIVAMVAVIIIFVGAIVAYMHEPAYKKLKAKVIMLEARNTVLEKQNVEKDKEIEALRLGLPWYNLGE